MLTFSPILRLLQCGIKHAQGRCSNLPCFYIYQSNPRFLANVIGTKSEEHAHVMVALTFCMPGNFSCFICLLLTFFQTQLFQNNLSETMSNCQTVWTEIRTDVLSALKWVQTVVKGYQQISHCWQGKTS